MTDQELGATIDKYFKFLKTDKPSPVTLYLDSLAPSGQRSMRSLLQTAASIFEFEGSLERMPWPLLQYHHFALIKSTLKARGKTANTINLTLAACKGVMKACFNLGLITADQLMQVNAIKRVRGSKLPTGRCLTNSEIKALVRVCKQDKTSNGKRDLAIIVIMLSAGLRRSEVIALQHTDYDSRNGRLLVNGKGNKQRQVFIQTDARKLIRPWLKQNADSSLLFSISSQAVYDVLKKRCKQAKIDHCSPHDLRRTFVTKMLEHTDINTVRQLAGHSDIQTTATYDKRDERQQKKAVKQASIV